MPSNEQDIIKAVKPKKAKAVKTEIQYGQGWGDAIQRTLAFPSGAVAIVHAPGVDKLVMAGVVDEVDFLQSLVQDKHIDRVKGRKPQDHKAKADVESAEAEMELGLELMKKPGNLKRLTLIMDKVAEVMVITPELTRPVKRDKQGTPLLDDQGNEILLKWEERDPEKTYTDSVAFEDRAHLLTYTVGKVANLQQFREQSE